MTQMFFVFITFFFLIKDIEKDSPFSWLFITLCISGNKILNFLLQVSLTMIPLPHLVEFLIIEDVILGSKLLIY